MKKLLLLIACSFCTALSLYAQTWTGLGINNPVLNSQDNQLYTVCADKAGNVYTAGMVYDTGWHTVVGKWDGTSWSSLATGDPLLDSFMQIGSIIADTSGNIYIVGQFGATGASLPNNVVKWDGTSWSKVGALNANGSIVTICFDKHNNLYAAGGFRDGSGHAYVAKWDGTSWTEIGTGVHAINANSSINSLYIDSLDNIYACGGFTDSAVYIGGNLYVAKWDGTSWSELGSGVVHQDPSYNTRIGSLVGDIAGNLYITGRFLDSGYSYVAKWDGTSWSKLGTGTHALNANSAIGPLCFDPAGNLYAAGFFTDGSSYSTCYHYVAKWDGVSWSHLGTTGFWDNIYSCSINSLCSDTNGNIYVGGTFTDTTITLSDAVHTYHPVYVAKYSPYPAGVPSSADLCNISIYPNPVHDVLDISLESITPLSRDVSYSLSDVLGRECRRGRLYQQTTQLSLRDLPSGTYVLHIANTGNVFKIIKE